MNIDYRFDEANRKRRKEMEIKRVNLVSATCLSARVFQEGIGTEETIKLHKINEFSKPGNGFELNLDKNGVEWVQEIDNAKHESDNVRVDFNPNSQQITVTVPSNYNVKVIKISNF